MTSTANALKGVSRLAVDTAPFIFYIEEHPLYLPRVAPVFLGADTSQFALITSTVTVAEVLVHPLRLKAEHLRDQYLDLFMQSANLEVHGIDIDIAQRAASLRADYNIRLPDAIQVAVALRTGCDAFLTNDRQLQRITALPILVVDDLEP